MGMLTVRNVDDEVQQRLKSRARAHGRSMESEVRAILTAAVEASTDEPRLGTRIAALFDEVDSADFEVRRGQEPARAVDFEQ